MKTATDTHKVDRSGWRPGPWDDESDRVEWRDDLTGLDCLAVRGNLGNWCGYVGVPPGHRWFGVGYDVLCDVEVLRGDLPGRRGRGEPPRRRLPDPGRARCLAAAAHRVGPRVPARPQRRGAAEGGVTPGPVSDSNEGPGERSPYVPSWCYPNNAPRVCPCGHHEGYHADDRQCLLAAECECPGIPEDRVTPDEEFS